MQRPASWHGVHSPAPGLVAIDAGHLAKMPMRLFKLYICPRACRTYAGRVGEPFNCDTYHAKPSSIMWARS